MTKHTSMSGLTVATYITLIRFLCVPLIIISMAEGAWPTATCVFVLASLTDLIDGMVARWRNEVSWLGTLLDPIADKLLLISIYAGLVFGQMNGPKLPYWFFVLVLLHELILACGTLYWAFLKQRVSIAPSRLAKLVGVAQFLFIFWTLVGGFVGLQTSALFYQILILIALARTCVLIQYGLAVTRRIAE